MEKQNVVLKDLYDLSKANDGNPVAISLLAQRLRMNSRDVSHLLEKLYEDQLIDWVHEDQVIVRSEGIAIIEGSSASAMNVLNIHGPNYGGIQQGTHSSTQTVNIFNSQTIGDILPQLKELLDAVRKESFPDKDDAIRDLEKAHQLALANPTASPSDGVWTRIQTKLNAAKTTMEIAGLAYRSLPYWPVVWEFFHRHL
jgi:hypothetical protein